MYDEKTAERIRRRAYELWLADQQKHGRDQAHWLQAEREVLAEVATEGKPAGGRKTATRKAAGAKKTSSKSTAKKSSTKKTASKKTAKRVTRRK